MEFSFGARWVAVTLSGAVNGAVSDRQFHVERNIRLSADGYRLHGLLVPPRIWLLGKLLLEEGNSVRPAMRAGCDFFLLRQPSRVDFSTPVGFAALAHTRCALIGQFILSIS